MSVNPTPPKIWSTGGVTSTRNPRSRAAASRARTTWFSALGIAIKTASAATRSATECRSAVVPITGTPAIRRLRLATSSSTRATGRNDVSLLATSIRTTVVPTSPAPATIRRSPSAPLRRRCDWV